MRPSTPTTYEMEEANSPRFTVQQILLLQKLKQSGLSRDDILKGLDEIDKNDDIPASPLDQPRVKQTKSPSPSYPKQQAMNGARPTSSRDEIASKDHVTQSRSPTSPQSTPSPTTNPRAKLLQTHPFHQAPHLMFPAHLQNPNQIALLHPGAANSWTTSRAMTSLLNGFPHHSMQQSMYPSLINGRPNPGMSSVFGAPNGNAIVEIDGEKIDITEELDDLFRRDQAQVKEDIRKFINERHISQSAIAKATGNAISQSYISQWLAQPQDISGQKKKAMYTWYLIEKRKPPGIGGIGSNGPIVFRNNDMEIDYAPPLSLKTKRGARFTWPKECLTILENYYNSNPYPDETKREEIATACNSIIQTHKAGMMMTELDKVTTVKVYNWFANRRKDDKRRKHIEHIESLDHHTLTSPTHRSNTVSPSSSNQSADSAHVLDVQEHSVMSERIPADLLVMRKKEEQMALALQMAAVNHSILALVNQHRDIISDHRGIAESRSPPRVESDRDENDDESIEGGSNHGNEKHGDCSRYQHEAANNEHPSKQIEIRQRDTGNASVTQSPIQART